MSDEEKKLNGPVKSAIFDTHVASNYIFRIITEQLSELDDSEKFVAGHALDLCIKKLQDARALVNVDENND